MTLKQSLPRFALVGLLATAIHVAVAAGLVENALFHPAAANGLAFAAANTVSYWTNTRWSFRAAMGLKTWRRFLLVSLIAWGLTVLIAGLAAQAGWHYRVGIAIVVVTVPLLSFAAHRSYTYR